MTNHPIDEALATSEKAFEIDLMNKYTSAAYARASVFADNTLLQIISEYADDIGVNPKSSKLIFENKRTGVSTTDTSEKVHGLGLQQGDVLAITDDGCNAADAAVV